ncbi:MAG: adenosylcobinamide-phosphate synthase CbiB [Pseudomonadota bacterium]
MELSALQAQAAPLAAAVVLDLLFGDPQRRWHPIRLVGASIARAEAWLRALRLDGYAGGILLGAGVAAWWAGLAALLVLAAQRVHPALGLAAHAGVAYFLLALRDLVDHVWAVEAAARQDDLGRCRAATAMFVSRDTEAMDLAACRRAAVESLSENLTDGYISPLFWYLVAGLPGLVVFKVFSTLDSMVGYRSERYLRFGWFSARTDDVLNWLPARATWLLTAAVAALVPRCSAPRALAVGWRQHGILPGPNSGWSEAAMAGALRRRLVGPIFQGGHLVTQTWLGDAHAPPAGLDRSDVPLAIVLAVATGLAAAALAVGALAGVGKM